jgi:hypothetical protein
MQKKLAKKEVMSTCDSSCNFKNLFAMYMQVCFNTIWKTEELNATLAFFDNIGKVVFPGMLPNPKFL